MALRAFSCAVTCDCARVKSASSVLFFSSNGRFLVSREAILSSRVSYAWLARSSSPSSFSTSSRWSLTWALRPSISLFFSRSCCSLAVVTSFSLTIVSSKVASRFRSCS
ncbi:hypothetical protein BDQ94DRAFT_144737 [Aspergillus welwitschiae]|uniref:Uncharacterized protein n=1 Tax=Aspergillus welwitschiae TaxID=1341132 RepID=A0A3F3Q0H5_9EURO|nr:hypothetical protein BDQ94DRAFT_144737 [Aspergillus welwitschiae]RDH32631.1 hypothetical protein BDQ94DRAFT_144737 [Aspergillus welwitschiae]